MNDRRHEGSEMTPAGHLRARLRALGAIEPPGGLRDKLRAAIPGGTTRRGPGVAFHRFRVLRYVGVAAAVIVMASVIVQCFAPSSGPPRFTADTNDPSGAVLFDQNTPRPRDINVCDNNAVP